MKKTLTLWIISILLSSCLYQPLAGEVSTESIFPAEDISIIQIELGQGDIFLELSENNEITISDNIQRKNKPTISISEGIMLVELDNSLREDLLRLTIPESLELILETYQANVELLEISGKATIKSTAGNIRLSGFTGEAQLRTGRGNITVEGGQGKLILIGEHGLLTVRGFHGPVSISTIMGGIDFTAPPRTEGEIHLESDHAPVTARLPEDSDYRIEIKSSGGQVYCTGASLIRTTAGCSAETGSGRDSFEIRTVSGKIIFMIDPNPGNQND